MKPYIIALTGGIASGKTTAAKVFEKLGAKIIDADVISRKVTAAGSAGLARIEREFPGCVKDGELDRKRLKSIVFSDSDKLAKLNAITWTLIEEEIRRSISELAETDVAVLVVPLLFESGLERLADVVVTVSADEATRIRRVMSRDGVDEATARAIVNSQLTDFEREKRSDYVLGGNSEASSLEEEAAKLYEKILSSRT